MSLVDLTQPFRDGMVGLSMFPRVTVERCATLERDRVNITRVEFAVHSGTHIDAPRHFIAGGRSMEQLTLDELMGPAVGLEVKCDSEHEVTKDDLERNQAEIRKGDMVFLNTGWGRYFHDDPDLYRRHPYLSIEAAEWLLRRGAKMLAVDIPTPELPETRRSAGFNWPVHHLLLSHGVLIAEHLANLHRVAGRRFRGLALPIPIAESDGAPARIVAEVD